MLLKNILGGKGRVEGSMNILQCHNLKKNDQRLKVINSIDLDITLGNTRGTNKRTYITDEGRNDHQPLHKRRRCGSLTGNNFHITTTTS